MTSTPKVSVVMSSYNHAPFVGEAIESVLSQSLADFEFLITDDGSSDGTPDIIATYSDPRLRFSPLPRNIGAAAAYNTLIEQATGEYIAVIASDDIWLPERLEFQVSLLDRLPDYGASFGQMIHVDLDGNPHPHQPQLVEHDIDQPSGWHLRRFMASANALNHPTSLIRRSVHEQIGLYDNRFRQMFDFELWVRLVKHSRIHVTDRQLVKYRWQQGHNTSAQGGFEQVNRDAFEHRWVGERILEGATRQMLLEGFGDLLIVSDLPTKAHSDIESALLHLRPELRFGSKLFGIDTLYGLLESTPHRQVMESDYGISDLELQSLAANVQTQVGIPGWFRNRLPETRAVPQLPAKLDDASSAPIPCVIVCYLDAAPLRRALASIAPDAHRLELIVVENASDNGDEIAGVVQDFMRKGVVKRYLRFDRNIQYCAIDTVLRREIDLQTHPFVIVGDADLELDAGWLDESLGVVANHPEVLTIGMTLHRMNIPPGPPLAWVGRDLVGDRGDYIETTTGCLMLVFRGPELQNVIDVMLQRGKWFFDPFLHDYCYGELERRWARTKFAKAYHITWDYYHESDHPYTRMKASISNEERYFVRRRSGYSEYLPKLGWVRKDISDEPNELFQTSLDSYFAGDIETGMVASDRVLNHPDIVSAYRDKAHENLRFYARPLAEIVEPVGFIQLSAASGTRMSAPTIAGFTDGFVVLGEAIWEPDSGLAETAGLWAWRFDADLQSICLPEPLDVEPSSVGRILRDVRLSPVDGGLLATLLVEDPETGLPPTVAQAALELETFRLHDLRLLGSGPNALREPCSLPGVVDGQSVVVQARGATAVLRPSPDGSEIRLLASHPAPRFAEWFRSGSQLVPFEDGFLAVVRETAEWDEGHQDLHRLVRFDGALRMTHASHAFTFHGQPDERCNGIAIDGDRVLLAFDIGDGRAFLMALPLEGIRALLHRLAKLEPEGPYAWPAGVGLPALPFQPMKVS